MTKLGAESIAYSGTDPSDNSNFISYANLQIDIIDFA